MSADYSWEPATPPSARTFSLGMAEALARRNDCDTMHLDGLALGRTDTEWLEGVRDAGGSISDEAEALLRAVLDHGTIILRVTR